MIQQLDDWHCHRMLLAWLKIAIVVCIDAIDHKSGNTDAEQNPQGIESRLCKHIYILILCQTGTCVAQPRSILRFVFHKAVILSVWLVRLVPQRLLHTWTLSVTVYCLNPPSVFRPTMRSLLKRANNNTCSSESQDISVKLIGSLVQQSCLIRHICGYFRNYQFQYSATLGRCAIKSPIPSPSPLALVCGERRLWSVFLCC